MMRALTKTTTTITIEAKRATRKPARTNETSHNVGD
jgi:hypothetical protein